MSAWPDTLPIISTVDAYGFEPGDPVLRTEMDSGPVRARQRFSNAPTTYSLAIPMTGEELAAFETFHKHTLHHGADAFDMPLVNGQGRTVCEARFTGPWRVKRVPGEAGRVWEASFSLTVNNRPVSSS